MSRRAFLGLATVTAAAAAVGIEPLVQTREVKAAPPPPGTYAPLSDSDLRRRRLKSFVNRTKRAKYWKTLPLQQPLANDDELSIPGRVGQLQQVVAARQPGSSRSGRMQGVGAARARRGRPRTSQRFRSAGRSRCAIRREGCRSSSPATTRTRRSFRPPRRLRAPGGRARWSRSTGPRCCGTCRCRTYRRRNPHMVAQACDDLSALSDFRGPKEERARDAEHALPRPVRGVHGRTVHLAVPAQGHRVRGAGQHAAGAGVRAGR